MDLLTDLIVKEIKKQYRSVRQFALTIGIPQTTVVSSLKNGVGGTSYDTVIKICEALNIRTVNYKTSLMIDDNVVSMISRYNDLDEKGKHTVDTILEMESNRCTAKSTGCAVAYGGDVTTSEVDSDNQKTVQRTLRGIRNTD